jgi:hypothetical protein
MKLEASKQQLRRRFEAWSVQIYQLLRSLPDELRRFGVVQRLIEQHGRVRGRIAAWSGTERESREIEREWSRLKRAWSRALDVVEIAT